MAKAAADKQPTFSLLVQRALEDADDFLTLAQLKATVPELTSNRATASLAHLYKRRVVGFMVEDGVTYWYATPDTDTRTFFMEEKVREEPGTRKPRTTNAQRVSIREMRATERRNNS